MPDKRFGVNYNYSAYYDDLTKLSVFALRSPDSWLNHEIKYENPMFI